MQLTLLSLLFLMTTTLTLCAETDKDSVEEKESVEYQFTPLSLSYRAINTKSLNQLLDGSGYPGVGSGVLLFPCFEYGVVINRWYFSFDVLMAIKDVKGTPSYSSFSRDGITSFSSLDMSHYYSLCFGRSFPLYEKSLTLRTSLNYSSAVLQLNLYREHTVQNFPNFSSSTRESSLLGMTMSLDYYLKLSSKGKEGLFLGIDAGYTFLDILRAWSARERFIAPVGGPNLTSDHANLRSFYLGIRLGSSLKF